MAIELGKVNVTDLAVNDYKVLGIGINETSNAGGVFATNFTTLTQAKENAKKYALEGWYFAIYKATDENPLGDLVGRWTYSGGRVKKFYMPGERSEKKKNMWA